MHLKGDLNGLVNAINAISNVLTSFIDNEIFLTSGYNLLSLFVSNRISNFNDQTKKKLFAELICYITLHICHNNKATTIHIH